MSIQSARYVLSARSRDDFVADGRPQVAFVGRSNVGKSTLLNRLLGRKALARTSSSPGRTQAINYFLIDDRYYFVDLPGYGYAKVSRSEREKWAQFIDEYLRDALPRAHVVHLVDGKVGATPLDVDASVYLRDLGAEPTVVATKMDRVPRSRHARAQNDIRSALDLPSERPLVPFSSRSGDGTRELWTAINGYLERTSRQRAAETVAQPRELQGH